MSPCAGRDERRKYSATDLSASHNDERARDRRCRTALGAGRVGSSAVGVGHEGRPTR
jgi:hypothetical protein